MGSGDMGVIKYIRVAICLLFFLGISIQGAEETKKPKNYYDLIGLDYAELQSQVDASVQEDAKYKAALQKVKETKQKKGIQEGESYVADKELKTVEDAAEKIRQNIEHKIFSDKIRQACKKTQREIQEQIAQAQKMVSEADDFERLAKEKQFQEVQRESINITQGCQLLLDPKRRAAYNQKLVQAPKIYEDEYFQQVQLGIERASFFAPNKKVIVNDIIGNLLSEIPIPDAALKIFNQDLAIRNVRFLPRPMGPQVQYGIGFTGLMGLNKFEVQLAIYIIQDIYGARKFSFIVALPDHYKISDLFPTFKKLDEFKFPRAKFIIASFQGTDEDGFSFKKGFNFVAHVDLSGPLQVLNTIKDKAAALRSLVFESKPIELHGVITPNLLQSQFSAKVPLYVGVDLQKIDAVPKTLSDVINKITSDDFTLLVSPVKPKMAEGQDESGKKVYEPVKPYVEILKAIPAETDEKGRVTKRAHVETIASIPLGFKIQAETGIRITLGTQRDPIRLNVIGTVIPISKDHPQGLLSVGGNMKGMLELKWLAIGNVGMDFDWDGALMPAAAAAGLPFTGIGIRGQLDLGKPGISRAQLKLAGGFRVTTTMPPDIVFEASGESIRFADMVSYASSLAAKAKILKGPIPVDRIPTMTLHKVWGYCAVKDTSIAGKAYRAGLGLQVETQLFDYKAGFKIFMNDKFQFNGWGYIPRIDFKVKGKDVFQLYGLTRDKGAQLSFNFDPAQPLKGMFSVEGTVHVPALSLTQKTNLQWRGYTIDADFETKFDEFSVLFGLRMNTRAGVLSLSEYEEQKRALENTIAGMDQASSNVIAAKNLISKADQLYRSKQATQAAAMLAQAEAMLGEIVPSGEGVIAAENVPALKEAEATMRALKEDVDRLFKRADDMLKQDEPQYRALEGQLSTIVASYQQYYSPESKERWDTLYNMTYTKLEHAARKAPPVTEQARQQAIKGAQRTVVEARLTEIQNILTQLQSVRKGLYELLGEKETAPTGAYLMKKRDVEVDPSAKWSKLYIKFGFKGDFAKFINKNAVENLRKVKNNAVKKLDELTAKMASLHTQAVGSVEDEIKRTNDVIAKKEQEIAKLQSQCKALPLYKQPKCRASIAAQKAIVTSKKAYVQLLLKPGKAVVKKTTSVAAAVTKQIMQTRALQAATEAILEGAATGLEMIATGINFFNIVEARGEYSWEDMSSFKLPKLVRLVAKLEIPDMPMEIVLQDLQFDFKKPVESAREIGLELLMAFAQGQQNKYLQSFAQLAQ
jgi:hypothetical protein